MHLILKPLQDAASNNGVPIMCADGKAHMVVPALGPYVADYPEQCLVSCTKATACPCCKAPVSQMGPLDEVFPERTSVDTLRIIQEAKANLPSHAAFYKACLEQGVSSGVICPF